MDVALSPGLVSPPAPERQRLGQEWASTAPGLWPLSASSNEGPAGLGGQWRCGQCSHMGEGSPTPGRACKAIGRPAGGGWRRAVGSAASPESPESVARPRESRASRALGPVGIQFLPFCLVFVRLRLPSLVGGIMMALGIPHLGGVAQQGSPAWPPPARLPWACEEGQPSLPSGGREGPRMNGLSLHGLRVILTST
ncbi:hypothetical protein GHT09_009706 [Marmota monax]|uniref:Uncharacterized protein n=1 Tax=Marmota monax TaxID=9995 RepID=A0A834QMC9_MARMO|nr:hypothetical protein GHT09_009706 [Marmota monax]